MRWATRTGVHIDRAACAWLIRRHLDPAATFICSRPHAGLRFSQSGARSIGRKSNGYTSDLR
jgi:hypothetical protein